MKDAKHAYRDVKTALKKTTRAIDGTDLKDRVANAGDEASKDLGNLGDDVPTADRKSKSGST
jgi:hypothetical protein